MLDTIPGPPGYPILGNILDVRNEVPIEGLANLADKYGPIYKLTLRGKEIVVVSNCRMLEELCDETRFCKAVAEGLARVKRPGPSGLFTAHENNPDWGQAHRVLMPAFGPLAISEMFDEMLDIASQLVLKWARKGPDYRIPVTNDFTRLTLDTIALCAMDFRFNSFYQDEMHPFVLAMNNTLSAGNGPSNLWDVIRVLRGSKSQSLEDDQGYMLEVAGKLTKHRREHPSEKKDLLNAMMNGKDPRTGEGMRDELISANMITFLVAGHETTSGLLSFAFLRLLKNPAAYRAAQAEVDKVVGKGKIRAEHLKDLKYLNAVLRETLRLNPTVPAFVRQVRDESKDIPPSVGGYELKRDQKVVALISKSQQDPDVYGEDAKEFKPERMMDGNFQNLPKSAWKPFGSGMRACIGRPFAWQEALLVTALVLQTFDLKLDDPSYEVRVKQTLTVKPRDFFIGATLREGIDATKLQKTIVSDRISLPENDVPVGKPTNHFSGIDSSKSDMLILYGSNTGTCEILAQRLASDSGRFGYRGRVMDMDSAVGTIPRHQTVVVITASYEGQPPDNAAHFMNWLASLEKGQSFEGLDYAVFGCGHSDWSATFQRIPTLVDETLGERQGRRMVPRGVADAAKGDIFSDFDRWADHVLWPAIAKQQGTGSTTFTDETPKLEIEISHQDRASRLRQDVHRAVVQCTKSLVSVGEPEKRHMEILLPSDMAYEHGDYLAVLPLNPHANVQRVMIRYQIPWDANIVINANGPTTLPEGSPMSVAELLKGYVEISQPATRKDITKALEFTQDTTTKSGLESFTDELFEQEILAKRVSILDLLERYPSLDLPFNVYLAMLPPMRLRHYSISSSPLVDPSRCSITYSVVNETSLSGHGKFLGVAGSYLKSLEPGNPIQVAVHATNHKFHLPLQAIQIPVLMFCAGTGLAPFRGFLQHRAVQLKVDKTRKLAPALLFIGCRSNTSDRLYGAEIDTWREEGVVDVRYAFSKECSHPDANGCAHIQDRMIKDKETIFQLWDQGAKVFVCGSAGLAEAVGNAARTLVRERVRAKRGEEVEEERLKEWFLEQRNQRFVTDVFS